MRSKFIFAACLLFLGAVPRGAAAFGKKHAQEYPCPSIRILKADDLGLSDTEIRLLCGDPGPDRSSLAWKDIPSSQAEANFRNFLQERGYLSPTFRQLDHGVTEFDRGLPTRIRRIQGTGIPPEVHLEGYRASLGRAMTPAELARIESWAKKRMQEEGYPCPEIKLRAFPDSGDVMLEWQNPSPRATIVEVLQKRPPPMTGDVPAVLPNVMRRFDAFDINGPYSLVLTEITERRSTDSQLVSAQDFIPDCPKQENESSAANLRLTEELQVGPPRLVRFELSANTEVGPEVQASWAHTRLSQLGSSAEIAVQASLQEQLGRAQASWYFRDSASSPQRLTPLLRFSHENKVRYELLALRTQTAWETDAETAAGRWQFSSGPGWQNIQQLTGVGPPNSQYASLKADVSYESHEWEYQKGNPRQGIQVSASALSAVTGLDHVGHPLLLSLQSTWLTYPGVADPPWFILGVRGRVFSTIAAKSTRDEDLPIDFRQWVGGGQDVRGFGLQELPDNDVGATRGVSGGVEIRVPQVLPWGVDPFVFVDGAWVNSGFWSPGFGFRGGSPVGTVRATVAHGFATGDAPAGLSHWQFYLSLGEEF